MLGVQMHLTALNAKSEPEEELVSEFDRALSKEPPAAIEWAFVAWRDRSPFFPAISDIRKLLNEWRRAERERQELESQMEEKFLLEERRRQGQVPNFADVVKQLQAVADGAEPEFMKKQKQFRQKMEMQPISLATATLNLTEDQIRARRDKEIAEIRRYQEHSDNEFNL